MWALADHDDGVSGLPNELRRHEWKRWCAEVSDDGGDVVGEGVGPVAVELQELAPLPGVVEDEPCQDRTGELVELVFEGGDDAEVAAAAANAPEELLVLKGGRANHAAVGEHDLGLQETVRGEAEFAHQVANTAAGGEACDACVSHVTAGDGEAVCLGRRVQLAPGDASPSCRGAGCGIDVSSEE